LSSDQLRQLRALLAAAVTSGHLPRTYFEIDKRTLETLNHDVFDVQLDGLSTVKAIIVQVRRFSRNLRKGYTRLSKEYVMVTREGSRLAATKLDSGTCVKRAKTAKALGQLVAHYCGGPTLRCKTPAVETADGYKILAIAADGTLRSVYDGSQYRLNTWRSQKAKDNHGGGFYFYRTEEEALEGMRCNATFAPALTAGKELALCWVEVSGRTVSYGSGKQAASRLRVIEVLQKLQHGERAAAGG
jgi:hypothetical protein